MKRDTHFARTKIIGTIGPATNKPEIIADMIRAGLDVIRINFSHGSYEEHAASIAAVKEGAKLADNAVAILADLCGPKIRLSKIDEEFDIETGETVVISTSHEAYSGPHKVIPTDFTSLAADVKPADRILIDDGLLQLVVQEASGSDVICQVIDGGRVKSRKGMNLPNVNVSVSAITEKDRQDLDFIVKQDVDFIALSFVRDANDIRELRWLLKERNRNLPIIAKLRSLKL